MWTWGSQAGAWTAAFAVLALALLMAVILLLTLILVGVSAIRDDLRSSRPYERHRDP